jgi:hypothetical protein
MTRDTLRDQIWKQIVEHRDSDTQFSKTDIVESVEASERTVHDVIQTASEYGLLDRREVRLDVEYEPAQSGVQRQEVAVYRPGKSVAQTRPQPDSSNDTPNVSDDEDGSSPVEELPAASVDDSDGFGNWTDAMDVPQANDPANCAQAVSECVDHLGELGEDESASAREIIMAVMPDHPLGYDIPDLGVGDRYRGAWWRKIVQKGLKAHPDVQYRMDYKDYRIRAANR